MIPPIDALWCGSKRIVIQHFDAEIIGLGVELGHRG